MAVLPSKYHPYEKINICTNTLTDVRIAIESEKDPLLVLGKGNDMPEVWIAAPSASRDEAFNFVVKRNEAMRDKISIERNAAAGTVQVFVDGTIIMAARELNSSVAEVAEIDLRLVGLDVFCDVEGLHIGGRTAKNEKIRGQQAAFQLDTS